MSVIAGVVELRFHTAPHFGRLIGKAAKSGNHTNDDQTCDEAIFNGRRTLRIAQQALHEFLRKQSWSPA